MAPLRPHVPVLEAAVVDLFLEAPDGPIVDMTLGAGGHARSIAEARRDRFGSARIIGLDRDPDALTLATTHLADVADVQLDTAQVRFDDLDEVLDAMGVDKVAGVFADLGISSMHIDRAERGFSYRADGPLDMRMDPRLTTSAADLVNTADAGELVRILSTFGEEAQAKRIVAGIVAARPVETTHELAEIIVAAYPAAARRRGGHPATKTFQALRIAVNGELDAVALALPRMLNRVMVGGVVAVLAYHSLEDRLIKRAFAAATRGCICPPDLPVCGCGRVAEFDHLVRRPQRPDEAEVTHNSRASAARLRAVVRTTKAVA